MIESAAIAGGMNESRGRFPAAAGFADQQHRRGVRSHFLGPLPQFADRRALADRAGHGREHLPVRYLIYIAVTALTRVLAIDIKTMSDHRMMIISAAILLLSLSLLVIRFGADRFPTRDQD